jgi:hypothetical protein
LFEKDCRFRERFQKLDASTTPKTADNYGEAGPFDP